MVSNPVDAIKKKNRNYLRTRTSNEAATVDRLQIHAAHAFTRMEHLAIDAMHPILVTR
jgi:hypothetical protein